MGNEVKRCQQPQAHPERCGCAPAGTEQVSSTWLAQLREEYRLFGSECQRLRAELQALKAVADATGRTPKDYAVEHAEYMAKDAESLLDTINELSDAEEGVVRAEYELSEAMGRMREGIYEFRKRRDRALAAAPKPAEKAQEGQPFQARVLPWLLECFGEQIASDAMERNHRFLEEALELVQACGCTIDEAHKLVDYVFGRSIGERQQEVGGVMVTLAALCLAQQLDMHYAGELELARITQPEMVALIREKQKRKPAMSPLPGIYPERQEMTS